MLGRGGMAFVYSARHVELGRRVALKVIAGELSSDPEFVDRFRREGRLQASLENPHVVTVYEAGESEQGLYLALQLVQGSTLAVLMAERALDATRALVLLRQVAEALDAAHAAGLVHRDVKPQNVLVGDSDDAYLGDFGLTRMGGATGVTATGKLLGTISYLAPEVIHGEEAVPASDRYAFAATAFECLTGTVVYPRRTEAAVLYAHTSEPPPRISQRRSELPPALDDVFARALSKDPGERPDSARGLVDTIGGVLADAAAGALGPPALPGAAALEGTTVEPLPTAAPSRRARVDRRTALWLAGAAVIVAVVAAAIGVAVGNGGGSKLAAVPAPIQGAKVLGSDLAKAGRTLDCRGRQPTPSSPECTIVQSELPGKTLVVPENGVIRRWAVRSARGELSLAVVRPRAGGAFQVARSRNEFVDDDQVHAFNADVAVEQGDLLGVVTIAGSAVGARDGVDGATTERWIPHLGPGRPATLGKGSGFDDELLLRVEYVAGGRQRVPQQVNGARASRLRPGRVRAHRTLHFKHGLTIEEELVAIGRRFALDELVNGRRTARIGVPGFLPKGGRLITFEVDGAGSDPPSLGVYIEYANAESTRILSHYYGAGEHEFEFVN
jgi:protein kinase-like protein